MFQPQELKRQKRQGSEPRCSWLDPPFKPVKTRGQSGSSAAASCTTIAFVPQLVQEESCKFLFVSSTLTEGCDSITQSVEYTPFKRCRVGSSPTGVKFRLVVQWTERLGSNEKVLGSNPSKAEASPISSVDRARCYERRLPQVRILHGGPTSVGAIGSASSSQERG